MVGEHFEVTMATLNELVQSTLDVERMLYESGGEITEEIENLIGLGDSLKTKLDNYAHVIETMKMRKEYATERMKEWSAILNTVERAEDNLKSRLLTAMTQLNTQEIHGLEYTCRIQANPPKVKIVDEKLVPGEFLQTTMETKINKREILDAIKDGRMVPGCDIERTERVVLKPSQRKLK